MVVDDLRPSLTYLPIGSSSVCCGVDKNRSRYNRVIEMKRKYMWIKMKIFE